MELQPNILDWLYSYNSTTMDNLVFALTGSDLLDLLVSYDACGMVEKALDVDIDAAERIFMAEPYDINTFLADVYNYFGNPVYQNMMQQLYPNNPMGNVLESLTLKERHIYGSSRVGIYNSELQMAALDYNGDFSATTSYSVLTGQVFSNTTATVSATAFASIRGHRSYELSNHLGNVLVTISDSKKPMDANADGTVDYYLADLRTAQDYYAFGAPMETRKFEALGLNYRFGFNGMEKDDEVNVEGGSYDFGARIYDSRLGRWLSTDPEESSFPNFSTYSFCFNSPIAFQDPDGESGKLTIKGNKAVITSHIYFYGGDANKRDARRYARQIRRVWNAQKVKVMVDGKMRRVRFKVTASYVSSEADIIALSKKHDGDAKFNFVRVENIKDETASWDQNHGFISTNQKVEKGRLAHEYGHGLGLGHPASKEVNVDKNDEMVGDYSDGRKVSIMEPYNRRIILPTSLSKDEIYMGETLGIANDLRTVTEADIKNLKLDDAVKNNGIVSNGQLRDEPGLKIDYVRPGGTYKNSEGKTVKP